MMSRKVEYILKGLGIALLALVGFAGFVFIEVVMTGANLNEPSQMFWWLLMVITDIAVVIGLATLILRA